MTAGIDVDIVVPTVGRACIAALLESLAAAKARPARLVVVDDRPSPAPPLQLDEIAHVDPVVVTSGGRGPAAARNAGWRRCGARWVCFLDDDVVVRPDWWSRLREDLAAPGADVGAVQGRVRVPLPSHRPPTDRERGVATLGEARWITADMAVRRDALRAVGGFDERFPRAYREDTDLALRLLDAGWTLRVGERSVDHPVRAASWRASITAQRGNVDDALMRRLHGPEWRERGGSPRGALRAHAATTAAGATALLAAPRQPGAALFGAALWAAGTGAFWWRRVRPGPHTASEVVRMAVTSVVIPPAAVVWRAVGELRARRLAPSGPGSRWMEQPIEAVLFDRDGTLVHDVPYNGDPSLVMPVEGARRALDRLRDRAVKVGIVTNQSGVARGLIDRHQVEAVNARVGELLGPFDTVQVCPHGPDDGCEHRKPLPGMILAAAHELGVDPSCCAVVGDIGADVAAGLAAGARPILVPTGATLAREVREAPEVAADLHDAVDRILGAGAPHHAEGVTP